MSNIAFCPGHITGFFKAHIDDTSLEKSGSLGAGFSIQYGVTTSVELIDGKEPFEIVTSGYKSIDTQVSQYVLKYFLNYCNLNKTILVKHDIQIPIGYGLGSSGAVALSLAMALNKVLGTQFDQKTIGKIAHNAEVACKTGLGDVLGSYHGGMEIRTKAGAPGIGKVDLLDCNLYAILICFAPIPTKIFMNKLNMINGLGGKMVNKLVKSKSIDDFQDMSIEFGEHVGMITPRLKKIIQELKSENIKCGIAFFGETIFTLIPKNDLDKIKNMVSKYNAIIITSKIDTKGPRFVD